MIKNLEQRFIKTIYFKKYHIVITALSLSIIGIGGYSAYLKKTGTVTLTKEVEKQLPLQTNLKYFFINSIVSGKPVKVKEKFSIEQYYPESFYEGYITPIKTSKGNDYFIYSSMPLDNIKQEFNGNITQINTEIKINAYVVNPLNGTFQYNNKYIEVLFPIWVNKEWTNL